jgi:hypothetical protein
MNDESIKKERNTLSTWERRMRQALLVVARLGLAYLFFSQLFWKLPPRFGCPPDFSFTTGGVDANGRVQLQRTSGLCDWIGIEIVWSELPRRFLVTNLDNRGGPELALNLGWAVRLNGSFLEGFVEPNIRWFGWIIWGAEAFIFVSLFLGLFSRLGGLVSIGISAQLALGLAGISNPYEWEWSYLLMVFLSLAVFAVAPGRTVGVDAWLRPRLQRAAVGGNRLAGVLALLT